MKLNRENLTTCQSTVQCFLKSSLSFSSTLPHIHSKSTFELRQRGGALPISSNAPRQGEGQAFTGFIYTHLTHLISHTHTFSHTLHIHNYISHTHLKHSHTHISHTRTHTTLTHIPETFKHHTHNSQISHTVLFPNSEETSIPSFSGLY